MTDGDKQNPNYLDFYQGFLLGLEKIKTQYGYSVRVDLFNTRQESDRLRTIVDDADFRAARLIVGPVYEEELPAVIGYAEEYAVPVSYTHLVESALQNDPYSWNSSYRYCRCEA